MKILIIGGTGYIGSALYCHLRERNFDSQTVDLELFGNYSNPKNIKKSYQDLTKAELARYSVIIFLAAHSSVAMASNNPNAAFKNNVSDFLEFISKLNRKQKFIYASSSSVYSGVGKTPVSEAWNNFSPKNMYDLTKYVDDLLAAISEVNYFGLRFGTVCGPSPNLRSELILNSMTLSAVRKGKIEVRNPKVSRPILGMKDLCRAVEKVIISDNNCGIYNLASFNASVLELAEEVQYLTPSKIEFNEDSPTYDFAISSQKFIDAFHFRFEESAKIIIKRLVQHYKTIKEVPIRGDCGLSKPTKLPRLPKSRVA